MPRHQSSGGNWDANDERELLSLDSIASQTPEHAIEGVEDDHTVGEHAYESATEGTRRTAEHASQRGIGCLQAWLEVSARRGTCRHASHGSEDSAGPEPGQVAWERAGRGVLLGYAGVHLLVAAAMDLSRAAPAMICVLFVMSWYASGIPAVRKKSREWFKAFDSALQQGIAKRLSAVALMQLVLVATAGCILIITLVQHIQRFTAVVGMLACVGRYQPKVILCEDETGENCFFARASKLRATCSFDPQNVRAIFLALRLLTSTHTHSAFFLCPTARRGDIRWRDTVAPGLAIQVTLGYAVLSTKWGAAVFLALGRGAEQFLAFSYEVPASTAAAADVSRTAHGYAAFLLLVRVH